MSTVITDIYKNIHAAVNKGSVFLTSVLWVILSLTFKPKLGIQLLWHIAYMYLSQNAEEMNCGSLFA